MTPSKQQRQRRKQLHWQVIRKVPKHSVWKQLPAGSPLAPSGGSGPGGAARAGPSSTSLESLFTVVEQARGAQLHGANRPRRVALLSLARAHNICIRLAGGRLLLPWPACKPLPACGASLLQLPQQAQAVTVSTMNDCLINLLQGALQVSPGVLKAAALKRS